MSDAPERIWAEPGMPGYLDEPDGLYTVEYVRADMLQEIFARYSKAESAHIEGLEAKLAKAVEIAEKSIGWLRLYGADVNKEATTLAELKGQTDE